ncbi:MAG: TerB family tellurite resistance protein [Gammaproteobacteria bacterium]
MFGTIQGLLKKAVCTAQEESLDRDEALRMATVALLMEVARADYDTSDIEEQVILRIIERYFAVSARRALEISEAAESHADNMTSLYPLTRLITTECSLEERIELIRLLWEVTFADGHVDKHEEHLVRKVADLLYVPHKQFIRTRLQESGG